jgi:hypothetical protein
VNTSADEIEFEIKRLPRGDFKATVRTFSGGRWSFPDSKLFASRGHESQRVSTPPSHPRMRSIPHAISGAQVSAVMRGNASEIMAVAGAAATVEVTMARATAGQESQQ